MNTTIFLAGLFVFLLTAGGLGYTIAEFRRFERTDTRRPRR